MSQKLSNAELLGVPHKWQELNALWEKKKMPQKNFCKIHGISYGQFTNWRSRIVNARSKQQAQQRFGAVTLAESTPDEQALPTATEAIKINFPDGTIVSLPISLDEKALLVILSALRGNT